MEMRPPRSGRSDAAGRRAGEVTCVGTRGANRSWDPVVQSSYPRARARPWSRGHAAPVHARRRTARRRASSLAERPPGKQSDRSVSDPAGCDLRSRCLPCESKTVDSGRDHGPVRATSTSVTRSDVCSSCFIGREKKHAGCRRFQHVTRISMEFSVTPYAYR